MSNAAWPVFISGLFLSLSLIVAIGAQNAFVLRQGLRREHVLLVVMFCALADAVLITAGVLGMAQAVSRHPAFAQGMALAGAAFLTWYGWQALQRAGLFSHHTLPQNGSLPPEGADPAWGCPTPDRLTRRAAMAQVAAFTLLNPHVYLDTVLLIGSIGAQQPDGLRSWFIAGASLASLGWFTALGFGARWLAPLFARPRAWQVLDALIGLTMWTLSAQLLRHALAAA